MPNRPLPVELTRFVEHIEPTPEDRFQAWLAEQPTLAKHPRAPQGRLRIWISISLTVGMLAAICGSVLLNALR